LATLGGVQNEFAWQQADDLRWPVLWSSTADPEIFWRPAGLPVLEKNRVFFVMDSARAVVVKQLRQIFHANYHLVQSNLVNSE